MSGGVYGGDEVGALVFDPGHYSFRAGFAGEELPKAEIPSAIGILNNSDNMDENKHPEKKIIAGINPSGRKFYLDTNNIKSPKANVEIGTFLKDGLIEDFEIFDNLLEYAFKYFNAEASMHPILMTEDPLNTKIKRERLTELIFEKFQTPAFYVCKSAVLSAFANSRSNGLIIDSGATHTTAIPVYDGYCLTKAIVRTPLGGDVMTSQCKNFFEESNLEVIPPYMVAGKDATEENSPARWTKKPNLPEVTKSYHDYMCKEVIQDFQASVLQANDTSYDAEHMEKLSAQTYEFPNGYNRDFTAERYRIPEGLFDTSFLKNYENPNQILTIPNVVTTSINMCDNDLRSTLCSGVVVTGGNSLIPGFTDRLNYELSNKFPANMKLKLHFSPSSSERRFAPWIGGSILASLGSFQQLWISKQEYEENGKSIVEKKCP